MGSDNLCYHRAMALPAKTNPDDMNESNKGQHLAKLKRQEDFLSEYEGSCSKSRAAHKVEVKVTTLNEWRRDPAFAARMDAVKKYIASRVEDVVIERALNGTPKGVWHNGVRVGEEIEYDHQ